MFKISFQVFKFLARLFYNTYIASDNSGADSSSSTKSREKYTNNTQNTKLYDILNIPMSAESTDIRKVNSFSLLYSMKFQPYYYFQLIIWIWHFTYKIILIEII